MSTEVNRVASIRFVALVLALCLVPLSAQPTVSQSLAVESTGIVDRLVAFTVRNFGRQVITAWAVAGLVTYEDGKTERLAMSADGAVTGFPEEPDYSLFRTFAPGSTVRKDRSGVRLRDAPVRSISLIPIAVVFDDGTAVGDESFIAPIFEMRKRERRALEIVEQILSEESDRNPDARNAIVAAQGRLAAIKDEIVRKSIGYHETVLNLSLAMRFESEPGQLTLGQKLQHELDLVRTLRERVDLSYQRR